MVGRVVCKLLKKKELKVFVLGAGKNESFRTPERAKVMLALDVSPSMEGEPIRELNAGVQRFFTEIFETADLRQGLDVGIITFGEGARLIRKPSPLTSPMAPTLETSGMTPMGAALNLALQELREYLLRAGSRRARRLMPWLVVMSDGEPNDEWEEPARIVRNYSLIRELASLPIGVGEGANMEMLTRLTTSDRPPVRLHGLRFTDFFVWLKDSLALTQGARQGSTLALPAPGDWAR